jgi:hypothetical protein
MPNPLKPLDYQEVMDIWRKEKDLKSLAEMRRDFFPEVKTFVSRLKEEAQAEAAKDPYSTKTRSLNVQVANVTEKVTQVFEIRMEKILRMAIRGFHANKGDQGEGDRSLERVEGIGFPVAETSRSGGKRTGRPGDGTRRYGRTSRKPHSNGVKQQTHYGRIIKADSY